MFGLFGRKDPICGMKEEKGTGVEKDGKWFCNEACLKDYEKQKKSPQAGMRKKGNCGCCG